MVTSLVSTFTATGQGTRRDDGRDDPPGPRDARRRDQGENLAAKRAGIHEIILSEDNRKDISEIKPEYLGGLKFNYVKTNSDVLKLAVM